MLLQYFSSLVAVRASDQSQNKGDKVGGRVAGWNLIVPVAFSPFWGRRGLAPEPSSLAEAGMKTDEDGGEL